MKKIDGRDYQAVTPWIISHNAPKLLWFLENAFNAKITGRIDDPATGKVLHADAQLADQHIMVFSANDEWPATPSFIRLYTDNVRLGVRRSLQYGANLVTPITEQPFGDLLSRVEDPTGNLWWICEPVESVDQDELRRRLGEMRWHEPMADVWVSLERWFNKLVFRTRNRQV